MYICPNWPGYWEQVHGLGRSGPNWVDFSCHKKRPADGVSSAVLFYSGQFAFDMMNMKNLREESAGKIVGEDKNEQLRFVEQVRKLRAGETDYFLIVGGTEVIGQIPEGKNLYDYAAAGRTEKRQVTIFVREEDALMPDVLCRWMERLLPALLGPKARCLIPRNQWWSKTRTRKYFCCDE